MALKPPKVETGILGFAAPKGGKCPLSMLTSTVYKRGARYCPRVLVKV